MASKTRNENTLGRGRRSSVGRRTGSRRKDEQVFARSVPNRLMSELLGVCGTALARFGAKPDRRTFALLKGLPRRPTYAVQMLADADRLSRIHTQWLRKSGYFDADGEPKIIPVSGPAPSYEALCADCGARRERERLLALALALRMCSRMGRNRLACLTEAALFTGVASLMLARAIISIDRLLRTSLFNSRRGRTLSESLVERTAYVNLSEAEFLKFAAAMRTRVHDFIESNDRQLMAGAARDESAKASRRRVSGLSAFVFRD